MLILQSYLEGNHAVMRILQMVDQDREITELGPYSPVPVFFNLLDHFNIHT